MQDFFNSIAWYCISSICTLLGVVGTIITIRQAVKSKRENAEYKYLFKIAGQHLDLENKESIIQDYDKKIQEMKKTVNEQIPAEANRIALQHIYNYELQNLADTYTKVKLLQEQLDNENSAEDNELLKSVHRAIEPKYSQNRYKTLLYCAFVAISVISSFLSMILPYNIYAIILVGTLLAQLTIGFKILKDHISNNYSKKELISIVPTFFLAISIVFLIISILANYLLFLYLNGSLRGEYINDVVCLGAFVFSYIFHILLGILYFLKQPSKRKKRAYRIVLSNSLILFVGYICFVVFHPSSTNAAIFGCAIIGIVISLISELIFFVISYFRRNKPIYDTEL